MPYDFYIDVRPIVNEELAKLLITSTVERDTIKNWFYQRLLQAEKEMISKTKEAIKKHRENIFAILQKLNANTEDKEVVKKRFIKNHKDIFLQLKDTFYDIERTAARYTIDDIERIDEKAKEREKREAKQDNILRFYTELYAIFPNV